MTYNTLPMSTNSEIFRFLLRYNRTIFSVTAGDGDDDDKSLYENLTDAKIAEGRNFNYPRRLLLLLVGHPSLCLPEVLRDLNYSARRGALYLFFYRHHPNNPPSPSSTITATGATIFWRIRDGPGSKELIRAIIGFL